MVALGVVVVSGLLAYANGLGSGFILDDLNEIFFNPAIRTLWPPWVPMQGGNSVVARPLPYLSFAVDYAIWGLNPTGFHLFNIVVHLITAAGLVILTANVLKSSAASPVLGSFAALVAGVSGAVWVVHPLTTAAVTYIYQRIEVMASMFIVWSLVAASRVFAIRVDDHHNTKTSRFWQTMSILSACLAAASKETAVVIPPLVAAFWWTFHAGQSGERFRSRLPFLIGLCMCWLVLAAVILSVRADYPELKELVHPPLQYALTQTGVLVFYARLAVWPVGLSIDHDWPLAAGPGEVLPELLAVLTVGGLTVVGFIRRSPWSFPMVAAFLLLGPSSSFLPLPDIAFEHRMYLPLYSVVVLGVSGVAWCILIFTRRMGWKERAIPTVGILGGAVIIVVSLTLATWERNREWLDPDRLWQTVLDRYPNSARANAVVASRLARTGQVDDAIVHARRATLRAPIRPVFQQLARALHDKGEFSAWERLCAKGQETLADCGWGESPSWFDLGRGRVEAIRAQGRLEEASRLAQELAPAAAEKLGNNHAIAASLELSQLRCDAAGVEGAARCIDRAASLHERLAEALGADHPTTLAARTIWAAGLTQQGKTKEAETHLREIVRLERDRQVADHLQIAAAMETLAGFLLAQDRVSEAVNVRMAVCDMICPVFGVDSAVSQKYLRLLVSGLRAGGRDADAAAVLSLIQSHSYPRGT